MVLRFRDTVAPAPPGRARAAAPLAVAEEHARFPAVPARSRPPLRRAMDRGGAGVHCILRLRLGWLHLQRHSRPLPGPPAPPAARPPAGFRPYAARRRT